MIPIHPHSQSNNTSVADSFHHTLAEHWRNANAPAHPAPQVRLWEEKGFLVFEASGPRFPSAHPGANVPAGAFAEGLWASDCAELFLACPKSGRYIEFNLNPRGAWWACLFSAPRVRVFPGGWQCQGVLTDSTAASSSVRWVARLRVPVREVLAALGASALSDLRGNATFIVDDPAQSPRYFSLAALTSGRPDFHLPQQWPMLGEILSRVEMPGASRQ